MKTIAVEVTAEQSALVYVRVPAHWDPATLQQKLTPDVLKQALDAVHRPLWHPTAPLTATYVTPAPPMVRPDYAFPDEVEQLDWLEAA